MFYYKQEIQYAFSELPSYSYLDLFRNSNMRKITILSTIQLMLIACIFDISIRNITNLDFEFYFTFMAMAAIEFPADTLAILGINRLGRRWSASLSMMLCAFIIAICAFLGGKLIEK